MESLKLLSSPLIFESYEKKFNQIKAIREKNKQKLLGLKRKMSDQEENENGTK